MNRLTPELWLHSAFDGESPLLETRELDFNLARRSAVVIVRIVSQIFVHVDTLTGNEDAGAAIQEVDMDPDNVTIEFGGSPVADDVRIDSSRVLRHILYSDRDTATGGGSQGNNPLLIKDWSHVEDAHKPMSITNIRHHFLTDMAISNVQHGEVNIDYFIAELTLTELGILNASRR